MPAAHFLGLRPRLVFAQYPDDLLLAEATPFHRPSPFSGDGLYLLSAEFSGCRPVDIRFRNPKFSRIAVPEVPVNEDDDAFSFEYEVGLAGKHASASPAGDFMFPQNPDEAKL